MDTDPYHGNGSFGNNGYSSIFFCWCLVWLMFSFDFSVSDVDIDVVSANFVAYMLFSFVVVVLVISQTCSRCFRCFFSRCYFVVVRGSDSAVGCVCFTFAIPITSGADVSFVKVTIFFFSVVVVRFRL